MKRYQNVDEYIAGHTEQASELEALRAVLTGCGLVEEMKWGAPCYTLDGKHVVGIGAFKAYVGLWFPQGALLKDSEGVLVNAQAGRTRAQRQWRFSPGDKLPRATIRAYVREAADLAREGKQIKPQRNKPVIVPVELQSALAKRAAARRAFDALTPGKQREYAEHVSSAKREATRLKRVEKVLPMIESGVGLNDHYR